jgi:hypothetical protein
MVQGHKGNKVQQLADESSDIFADGLLSKRARTGITLEEAYALEVKGAKEAKFESTIPQITQAYEKLKSAGKESK